MSKIPVIYLDMDQVLVDFTGGVCDLFNVEMGDVVGHWQPGDWCMLEPLSKALGSEVSLDLFWQVIHSRGSQFWTNLKSLPWLDELIVLVERFTDHWQIVTSPSLDHSSYAGKVLWVQKKFGRKFDRLIPTRYKYLLAQPGTVLIDDREENCEHFEHKPTGDGSTFSKTGGEAIIFPSHHNNLYNYRNHPLQWVELELERLATNMEMRG